MYKYADNEENRLRGRVGRVAGWRIGTISPDFIPTDKHPKSRSSNQTATRYYDLSRMDWRAFRKDCFIELSAFLNKKTKEYQDFPPDASQLRNQRSFHYSPGEETMEQKVKRAKLKLKLHKKREEQIARERRRRQRNNKRLFKQDEIEKAVLTLLQKYD